MKWMGRWFLIGILAMIVSIIGFYKDSPKVGNIAFVIMTFSLFMLIFVWANINLLETTRTMHKVENHIDDRDGEE
jgi:hypothetical protein